MANEEALFQRFGREIAAGTVLFKEGDPGREMYVLQSGKVTLTKNVRDVEKVLAVLGPGEFFGEMAIISNKPRSATATVSETARLLVIDPRTFEAMIRGNAEIAVRLIKKLSDRLAEAHTQIERLLVADPQSRVVHAMLQAAISRGKKGPEGLLVEMPVRELHVDLGVSEQLLLSLLERMERSGLVSQVGPEALVVRDVDQLQEYLRFLEYKWKFGEG
ncbi:MAG: cyclic nucleotide-binding domain-containing protein [Deltaproteobacteria bacterium]|nr:cyclic nucleotide-binding domain-containing protein [Deltaproteobacteria bacterium]